MPERALICPQEIHREIFSVVGTIGVHQFVEDSRVSNLSLAQPLKKVQIKNGSKRRCEKPYQSKYCKSYLRFEDNKVTFRVTDIIPGIINLAEGFQRR